MTTEARKTYLYPGTGSKVLLAKVAGKMTVVESNCESFPVGRVTPVRELRACGWRLPKVVRQYDAWGRVIR